MWPFTKIKEYVERKRAENEWAAIVAFMHSDHVFSPRQKEILRELFPNEWTHMDNFNQDEIFQIALTMTLFGMTVDSHEKMIGALHVLDVQNICEFDQNNPMIVKRYT